MKPKTTKTERDTVDARIVEFLTTAPGSRSAAIAKGTGLHSRDVDRSLQRLRTAGRIEQRGYGRWHATGAQDRGGR